MSRSFIEEARRRQIVAAAIAVLAEEGYAQASLSRIAARAGISKSVIFYHFANKDAVFEAVFSSVVEEAGAAIGPHIAEADGAGARIAAYMRHQIAYFALHRQAFLAIGALAEGHGAPGQEPAYIAAALQQEKDLLEAFLREGQESGAFRNFDRAVMAMAMVNALEGVLTEWAYRPDTDLRAQGEEVIDLFARAMRADAR